MRRKKSWYVQWLQRGLELHEGVEAKVHMRGGAATLHVYRDGVLLWTHTELRLTSDAKHPKSLTGPDELTSADARSRKQWRTKRRRE